MVRLANGEAPAGPVTQMMPWSCSPPDPWGVAGPSRGFVLGSLPPLRPSPTSAEKAPTSSGALEDPLGYLQGTWSLRRRLEDHHLRLEGTFVGTLRVEPKGEADWRYHEEGILDWPSHRGQATRTLTCRRASRSRATFSFPDGRLFHDLELRPDGFSATHLCGEDRYQATFVLLGQDAWSATWAVEGPTKSLVLAALYQRLA